MRQIVLDTETTGLSTAQGHRVIEIGCVELVDRRLTGRDFHRFLNPDRDIDQGAEAIHGISRADLQTEPRFPEIVDDFLAFIKGAELIIHNATFDVGFLEHELKLMKHKKPKIRHHAAVLDTLALAREMHPGQRNSLDALCKRYEVDATKRDVHGALIDSELLANVYLAMTGGQTAMLLDDESKTVGAASGRDPSESTAAGAANSGSRPGAAPVIDLPVIKATAEESTAHDAMLEKIRKSGACVWDID
ncbi:MAG: DNA polymerase III subunit epsilon [Gammaproteobacteria bacterium]|jgi:DNA polymerase-3 subunit epsilon|nr:DNA polymerase III subunit epsilon [Gammaproteobacteria bacterium]